MNYRSQFFLMALALLFACPRANAAASPVTSTCSFSFEAKGTDIQILIGYSKLKGSGKITCVNQATMKSEELPFTITIGTPVLFPRIAFAPSLVVHGEASGITILKGGPKVLIGKYLTVDIRAAIGKGFARSLALEGQDNDLSISLDLEDIEGFGIAVGGTVVNLQ